MESKKERISEILCQQIELLAEESKNIQPNDKGHLATKNHLFPIKR